MAELEPGILGLAVKFYDEQERSIAMHRRAQRIEGDDAKARLAETRDGWRREIAKVYGRAAHQIARTRIMGRALRDLLVFYGASDTYVRQDGTAQKHGYTCFMVADLAAQRDAAKAETLRHEKAAKPLIARTIAAESRAAELEALLREAANSRGLLADDFDPNDHRQWEIDTRAALTVKPC